MVVHERPLRLTYADYRELPDDGKRYELVDGKLTVTPAPATRHQIASLNLTFALETWRRGSGEGRVLNAPVDVVLSDTDVVQPDVVYLGRANLARLTDSGIEGPPDLVVEILSEHRRQRDEVIKRHVYEAHGVAEYWIVDPELQTVKVLRLEGGAYRRTVELTRQAGDVLTSPRLPGFELALAELFSF